jgi:hypothetical protein
MVAERVPLIVGAHLDLGEMLSPALWNETVVEVATRRFLPPVKVGGTAFSTEGVLEMPMIRALELQLVGECLQVVPVSAGVLRLLSKPTDPAIPGYESHDDLSSA